MRGLYRWFQGLIVTLDIRFNDPELWVILTAQDDCQCGHPREIHTHYRVGTDCGRCRVCGRFRAA